MFSPSFPLLITSGFASLGIGAGSLATSTRAPTADPTEAETSTLETAPSMFLGDFDGDGLPDVYAIYSEADERLFKNLGDGAFEDVTTRAGLTGIHGSRAALWADFDRDGDLDLYLVADRSEQKLLHNLGGGAFEDVTEMAGLSGLEGELEAAWIDYDADSRPDLSIRTKDGDLFFHNTGEKWFERVVLGLPVAVPGVGGNLRTVGGEAARDVPGADELPHEEKDRAADRASTGPEAVGQQSGRGKRDIAGPPLLPSAGGSTTDSPGDPIAGTLAVGCAGRIYDTPGGSCIAASSTPTLGMLYPISEKLFVSPGGSVGIGTTTPGAFFDVAIPSGGAARLGLPGVPSEVWFTNGRLRSTTGAFQVLGQSMDFTATPITFGQTADDFDMVVQTNGNVGIGTNTPSTKLHLFTTNQHSIATIEAGGTNHGQSILQFRTGSDPGEWQVYMDDSTLNALGDPDRLGFWHSGTGNVMALDGSSGNLGIGTVNPAAKLDVAGTARVSGFQMPTGAVAGRLLVSDTNGVGTWQSASAVDQWVNTTGDTMSGSLTLNSGTSGTDVALNIIQGSIYKNGVRFIHSLGSFNTGVGDGALTNPSGWYNTANGYDALKSNGAGYHNTAVGFRALFSNTDGGNNTAIGFESLLSNAFGLENTACGTVALRSNTIGRSNSAFGNGALFSNINGEENAAIGHLAMYANSAGDQNTACGTAALDSNTIGERNIALGYNAGGNLTTGNDNIAIGNLGVAGDVTTMRIGTTGTHTKAFIAGIFGVNNGGGAPVCVNNLGQLATVCSSRRFKKDIADMGDATERLLELRPVVFRYKQEQEVENGEVPLEYGLIAEEVAEIFPDLVVYDDEGLPLTVKYHVLSSMLLNEVKKLQEKVEAQSEAHAHELEEVRGRIAAIEARTAVATLPAASSVANR